MNINCSKRLQKINSVYKQTDNNFILQIQYGSNKWLFAIFQRFFQLQIIIIISTEIEPKKMENSPESFTIKSELLKQYISSLPSTNQENSSSQICMTNQQLLEIYQQLSLSSQKTKTLSGESESDPSNLHQNIKKTRRREVARRTEEQIQKIYPCKYFSCRKSYGSEASLNIHVKLKHSGGSSKERKKQIQKLLRAEMLNQTKAPKLQLNYAPGEVEKLKGKLKKRIRENPNALEEVCSDEYIPPQKKTRKTKIQCERQDANEQQKVKVQYIQPSHPQ